MESSLVLSKMEVSCTMHSADELEKSVRVTPPSAWMALVAFAVLLAGLLAWAVFGTIATRVPTTVAVVDGQAMCFLSEEDVVKMDVGDKADVDGEALGIENVSLKVSSISTLPISRAEAREIVSADYLAEALMQDNWAYPVTFEGDTSKLPEDVPLSMDITVEQLPPINLLLRR